MKLVCRIPPQYIFPKILSHDCGWVFCFVRFWCMMKKNVLEDKIVLLKNISDEFVELHEMLQKLNSSNNNIFKLYNGNIDEFSVNEIMSLISITRNFESQKYILKRKDFKSKSVKDIIQQYLMSLERFTASLDGCVDTLIRKDKIEKSYIITLKSNANFISAVLTKIRNICEILGTVAEETWEPLPSAIKEDEYENVTILSETKSVSLGSISKDISILDNFLNNISLLIKEAKGNNFYLRKVESGSLAVVISCIAGASQIVSFIFFYIKLCQNTEKRELKNEERKLEIINKSLDTAKKILELDPQNTEANEIVQKCGLYILEFLENNPKGIINNQSYDIGVEKLKIEEKKED